MGSLTRKRDQEIVIVSTGMLRAGHMVDKDHDAARAAGEEVEEPPCLGLDSVEKDIIATRAARAAAKEEPTP